MLKKFATDGLACSAQAAADLYGTRWRNDTRFKVLTCGINLAPYKQLRFGREIIRKELGILAEDKYIIGHIGSFEKQKNHTFILDVFKELILINTRVLLLLISSGSLIDYIKKRVNDEGLKDRVTFTGIRSDVPELLNAMDVFFFPSLFEGLGLALIEAQVSGLPCLISDVIPEEADVVKSLS